MSLLKHNSNPKIRPQTIAAATLVMIPLLHTTAALAQSGAAGLQSAYDQVQGYFPAAISLMYAVGAVLGIVGAVKVFTKWNAGDNDTSKVAAAWFGSCIFLVVVASILKGFFGV